VATGINLDAIDSTGSRLDNFLRGDLPAVDNLETLLEKHLKLLQRETSLFPIRW